MLLMIELKQIVLFLAAFLIVAIAANQISRVFQRIHLPLITGLLIIGIIAGPDILGLITPEAVVNLRFINDIALSFIALAVGSELYLNEIRSRLRSIAWMTISQMVITFILSSLGVYLLADIIPFMRNMETDDRVAISILVGTIFIARSPASAIAIVNEMRARGPFTRTSLGVTVVIDFLVIMLFALTLSISETFITGASFNLAFAGRLIIELILACVVGYLLGKLISLTLSFKFHFWFKIIIILLLGYATFIMRDFIREYTRDHFFSEILVEPLLICIIGSFIVTNFSKHRVEFLNLIRRSGPPVYAVFFTLVGSTISLDVLSKVWLIAVILFGVRLLSLILASFAGGTIAGDPIKFNKIAWTPYITQAGVSIGLTAIVTAEFPEWSNQFVAIVLAVIVINQLIGPPLFKWAITYIGESHVRADGSIREPECSTVIFGIENQSIALARQLIKHGWSTRIAALQEEQVDEYSSSDIDITKIEAIDLESLQKVEADKAGAIVALLSDDENYKLCELAYENFGTRDMIVRLNERSNFNKFHQLGAKIVEPSTAIVSLLDHFVRSPRATSLLLGMQATQDTLEIELQNPDLHGLAIRNLRLPHDIIILSVTRAGQMIISHGYTRLRIGDILTLVGSRESLEVARLKFAE
jgi:Trk K+ transport system NAD-binding subunit/Kef-type K+ transport system membrane component KefB